MTTDSVKEELQSYKYDCKLIESIEEQVAFYEAKLTSCTSQISDTPRGGSPVHDKIAEYIVKLDELKTEKYTRLIELEAKIHEVEKIVHQLKQPYKSLLYITYLQEWQFEDVAGNFKTIIGHKLYETAYILGYEKKHASVLHQVALREYLKIKKRLTNKVY